MSLSSLVNISAKDLENLTEPLLSEHNKLSPNDKIIWDAAYGEEIEGLINLPCWRTITESEYHKLRPMIGNAIPTMAISTIKYDENGLPKRAKYRIVALGNLDPHPWSKSDLNAPVMSHIESRLLNSIAVHMRRTTKTGDVKQAFVQSRLPPNERYVLRPPPGCTHSKSNTFWLLVRSIYGLKRSPRHWYNKFKTILKSMNLEPCPNAPCIFTGKLTKDSPPIYIGFYVDDFIYFSEDNETEHLFETLLKSKLTVEFMGQTFHFLGMKYHWTHHRDGNISLHLSQPAFVEQLLATINLLHPHVNTATTPYRSGLPVDAILPTTISETQHTALQAIYRTIVGSMLWLSTSTRPDISCITSILAQHQTKLTPSHLGAAKYALRYLKGTKNKGITFSSKPQHTLASFTSFHLPSSVSMSDSNWGPQDASTPKPGTNYKIPLSHSRSQAGYIHFFNGPIAWSSYRQKITARSSCEAEIYATDSCTREVLHIKNLFEDLNLSHLFPTPNTIYNDNSACVQWCNTLTNRNLRHLQMKENAVRESVQEKLIKVLHCAGIENIADIFTKEDKDKAHYIQLRDILVQDPPKI